MGLQSEIFSWLDVATPLGTLGEAGVLVDTPGTGFATFRRLEHLALVLLIEGGGRYRDTEGLDLRLRPGDALIIPPGLGHQYAPERHDRWVEAFLTCTGAGFAAWCSPEGPLPRRIPLLDADLWLPEWLKIARRPARSFTEAVDVLVEIHQLLNALRQHDNAPPGPATRLEVSRDTIATWPPGEKPDWRHLAAACHLSYDAWRKAFQRRFGQAPAEYRRTALMQQAAQLLRRTSLTNEQLADQFGCTDASHFSRLFKTVHGAPPKEWRAIRSETETDQASPPPHSGTADPSTRARD